MLKAFTILAALVLPLLSVCIFVPAPNLGLLPFTVAAPEIAPWLIVLSVLAIIGAIRVCRLALPFVLVSCVLSFWPIAQIRNVHLLGANAAETKPNTASVLLDCFQVTVRGGLKLGSVKPQKLPMNMLYYPAKGAGLHPAIIDIYGGAWQRGSPADNRRFDSYMASRGFAVFAIDYRHAPASRFPAQLDDVQAALAFLYANAATYKVDPNRLILCGHSAGAQLALLAAYEPGAVPVRAVISFYGPTDLTLGYLDPPSPDPIRSRPVLSAYLGGSPAQLPELYRLASPVSHVRASLPATLLIQGERDHVVKPEFARELFAKLVESGNRAELLQIPWAEHAFDAVFFGLGNQLALEYVDRFLDRER